MYEENDLYNLDLDQDSTSETANEKQSNQSNEPNEQKGEAEQTNTADNKNQITSPEPQKSQDSLQAKNQLTEEQIAYIEKARQRDQLERVVNDIKTKDIGYNGY